MNSRSLVPLLISLALIAVGPIGAIADAHAATEPIGGKPPRADAPPPSDALRSMLDATRGQKARTGLGLPHYRGLIGSKKWESKVRKADAALAAQLGAPPAGRIAAAQLDWDDPLNASDSIKGTNGKQTRRFRVASAVDTGCPVFNPYGDGFFEFTGSARGEYEVKTVERIGRYDVTTVVLFEVRLQLYSQVTSTAKLLGITAKDGAVVTATRTQTARDRKTGKKRRTGPTQRLSEALSPLMVLDGDFDDFVAQQDEDERPAPRRPLRSGVWRDAAQRFVGLVYLAAERDFAGAEQRLQTPNECVELSFEGPRFLTPSQVTDIRGLLRAKTVDAPEKNMLEDLKVLSAEYVNDQGQKIEYLGGNADWQVGAPWYRFTAPPQAWPDSKPVGLHVKVATRTGVAEGEITFRAVDGSKVYFRVLDASVTSNWSGASGDHFCGTISGSQRFGGGFAQKPFNTQNEMHSSQGRWLGFVTGYIDAAWTDHHVQGCKHDELGRKVPCSEHLPDATPKPDGTWPIGFQILQPAGSSELELRWRIVPGTIGYIEPDEDECYVYLEGRVPGSETVRRIAPDQLLSGQPVTLTTSGSWSTSGVESFDYSWSYSMTIQRVGADGQPLG